MPTSRHVPVCATRSGVYARDGDGTTTAVDHEQAWAPTTAITLGLGARYDFDASCEDADGDPVTHLWNFDGASAESDEEDPRGIAFEIPGTFEIEYRCADVTEQSAPAVVVVTVEPGPDSRIVLPVADLNVDEGAIVVVRGECDGVGPLEQSWDFGGGAPIPELSAVVFDTPGVYSVRLTCQDARGREDPTPAAVTITVGTPLWIPFVDGSYQVTLIDGSGTFPPEILMAPAGYRLERWAPSPVTDQSWTQVAGVAAVSGGIAAGIRAAYVVNLNQARPTAVLAARGFWGLEDLAFSPDGARLAFWAIGWEGDYFIPWIAEPAAGTDQACGAGWRIGSAGSGDGSRAAWALDSSAYYYRQRHVVGGDARHLTQCGSVATVRFPFDARGQVEEVVALAPPHVLFRGTVGSASGWFVGNMVDGGAPVRVGSSGLRARVSRDGRWAAFYSVGGDSSAVFEGYADLQAPAGAGSVRVIAPATVARYGFWLSDGWFSWTDLAGRRFARDLRGATPGPPVDLPEGQAWLPDGSGYAYRGLSSGGGVGLYFVRFDPDLGFSTPVEIGPPLAPGLSLGYAAAVDGSRFMYLAERTPGVAEVWISDVSSAGPAQLHTPLPPGGSLTSMMRARGAYLVEGDYRGLGAEMARVDPDRPGRLVSVQTPRAPYGNLLTPF